LPASHPGSGCGALPVATTLLAPRLQVAYWLSSCASAAGVARVADRCQAAPAPARQADALLFVVFVVQALEQVLQALANGGLVVAQGIEAEFLFESLFRQPVAGMAAGELDHLPEQRVVAAQLVGEQARGAGMEDDLAAAARADQRAEPELRFDFGCAAGQEMQPRVAQQQRLDARGERDQPRHRRNLGPALAQVGDQILFERGRLQPAHRRGGRLQASCRRSIAALVRGCQCSSSG
jgi:hypothetical protein